MTDAGTVYTANPIGREYRSPTWESHARRPQPEHIPNLVNHDDDLDWLPDEWPAADPALDRVIRMARSHWRWHGCTRREALRWALITNYDADLITAANDAGLNMTGPRPRDHDPRQEHDERNR